MRFVKIIWNWVVREFMGFVNFVLKTELDKQKEELKNAKEESDDAVNDYINLLNKYNVEDDDL